MFLIKINQEKLAELAAVEAKRQRDEHLDSLTVTTANGNTFGGNETSISRMIAAIMSAETLGKTETKWKMADNSKVLIGLPELKEALALAIQEVGKIVGATE